MNKSIVLINLPADYLTEPDAQFPLGLLYLGTELKNNGYNVKILDFANKPELTIPDADIYGITATSMQIPIMNKFIEEKLNEKSQLIICGGYCSLTPEYISGRVDIIFKNHINAEGFAEAIKDYNNTRKLTTRNNSRMIYVGKKHPDLNMIPDRSLIEYHGGNIFYNKVNEQSTQLITSFGCNSKCAFCSSAGSGVFLRNYITVVKEINQITEIGIYNIRIADDNFLINDRHVIGFCDTLIKDRTKINFRISVRVHPFKEYLLSMLKSAGLKEVSLGVESFDQGVLNGLKKKTTVEQNLKAIEICNKLDIPVRILLMIGTPYQTEDTIKKNIDILKKIKYNIIAVSQFKPLPGSDIWNNPENYDCEILSRDLSLYNFYSYQNKQIQYQDSIIKLKDILIGETNRQNREFLEFVSKNKINKG